MTSGDPPTGDLGSARQPPLHVVDGYNLALSSPAFTMALHEGGLRALRDRLFEAVARDCDRRAERAVVVWDGADHGLPPRQDPRGAEESFSRHPEKADERIIALALELRAGGLDPVVVSDDAAHVRADAERAGLPWIGCADYEQRLAGPLPDDPHAATQGRHARRALMRLVAAGLVDDPRSRTEALVAELAAALAYHRAGTIKPHKMARAVVRYLREFGVEVRGGPHDHRALLAPLWEDDGP